MKKKNRPKWKDLALRWMEEYRGMQWERDEWRRKYRMVAAQLEKPWWRAWWEKM